MKRESIIFDETQMGAIAQKLVDMMPECQVFAFDGPLGAGKTTLIRQMLIRCGVQDAISSPTFTYLNVYENDKNQVFYHFDLYRLSSLDEFVSAGFDEYLYAPNSWVFIEWPAIVMPLLKKNVCYCQLDYNDNKRSILIKEE